MENTTQFNGNNVEMFDLGIFYLTTFGGLILSIVGIIGNTLSIVVFCQRPLKGTCIAPYFKCLALFDTFAIILGFVLPLLEYSTEIPVIKGTDTSCKMWLFLVTFVTTSSVLLVVAATIDRTVAMVYTQNSIAAKRYVAAIATAVMIAFLHSVHYLFKARTQTVNEIPECIHLNDDASSAYKFYTRELWPWQDLVLYNILPVLILTICDVILFRSILKCKARVGVLNLNTQFQGNRKTCRPLLIMLIVTNLQMIISTTPICIVTIIAGNVSLMQIESYSIRNALLLTYFINGTNYTLHFFTYYITGKQFRCTLLRIVRKCLPNREPSNLSERGQHRRTPIWTSSV